MARTTFKGPVNVQVGGLELRASTVSLQDGGAVTQITSAATGVTLNKPTGAITTVTQNIAAAGEVEFTVTNSVVTARSVILSNIASGSVGGTSTTYIKSIAAGSFVLGITNKHATVAETGILVINYVIFGGSNTATTVTPI